MTGLLEYFTENSRSMVMKLTLHHTSTLKKDVVILDFSEIVNSQAAFTTAKPFNKFSDGIIKFVHNQNWDVTYLT